jgi:hypothetical protein
MGKGRKPPGWNPRDVVDMKARKHGNSIGMVLPRAVAESYRQGLEPEGWTVEIHRIRGRDPAA